MPCFHHPSAGASDLFSGAQEGRGGTVMISQCLWVRTLAWHRRALHSGAQGCVLICQLNRGRHPGCWWFPLLAGASWRPSFLAEAALRSCSPWPRGPSQHGSLFSKAGKRGSPSSPSAGVTEHLHYVTSPRGRAPHSLVCGRVTGPAPPRGGGHGHGGLFPGAAQRARVGLKSSPACQHQPPHRFLSRQTSGCRREGRNSGGRRGGNPGPKAPQRPCPGPGMRPRRPHRGGPGHRSGPSIQGAVSSAASLFRPRPETSSEHSLTY